MSKNVAQPQDKYVLRLPDGLRDRLKIAAEANGRSLNAEIVARVERVISPDAEGWVRFYLPPGLISRIEEKAQADNTTPEVEIRDALEEAFPYAPTLRDYFRALRRDVESGYGQANPALAAFIEDTERRIAEQPELGDEPMRALDYGHEVGPEE